MNRPLVIDVSKSLPPRARHLSPAALPNIFGGCLAQGQACTSAADCCQVAVRPGDYVLCFFYRGHGIVRGHCTTSCSAYGGC